MDLLKAAERGLLALLQHSPAFIGIGRKRSTLEAYSRLIHVTVDRAQLSEEEIKANIGTVLRIRDPNFLSYRILDLGIRIQQEQKRARGGGHMCPNFFVAINFTKNL